MRGTETRPQLSSSPANDRSEFLTDRAADRAAFEQVYAEYADAVFRYALRRTAADADAEDVLAETFAVCWRRFDAMPAGSELPWLYGIARRVLANQRRSTGRLQRLRGRLQAEPPAPAAESSADVDAAVLAAMTRLSDADQELLRLSLWEGLSTPELAVALGVSENAVYIRLHRARQRLVALFETEGGAT
jgi:RNA polymerase sigma factor (sigma-70 family)